MQILTSNFYTSKIVDKNLTLVSIAVYKPLKGYTQTPNFRSIPCLTELAPTKELLASYKYASKKITEEEYISKFKKQLNKLNRGKILKKLKKLSNGNPVVLLCHCGKDCFCHRHIVADWLENKTKQSIRELALGYVERDKGKIIKVLSINQSNLL